VTKHLDRRNAPHSQSKRELGKESHRTELGQSCKMEHGWKTARKVQDQGGNVHPPVMQGGEMSGRPTE
jgi:hypothetical protein